MALAWITQVKNDSNVTLTLLQNDPSKHPVSNGHQFGPDEPIRVPPGATMDFSWFVIPWKDSGRLLVKGPNGAVTWQVGPFVDINTDTLQGRAPGVVPQNIKLGDRGGPLTADQMEFQLHATNSGITFVPKGAGVGNVFGWTVKLVATVFGAFF